MIQIQQKISDKNILNFVVFDENTFVVLDGYLNLFTYDLKNNTTQHLNKFEKKPTDFYIIDKNIYIGTTSGQIIVHNLSEKSVLNLNDHTDSIYYLNEVDQFLFSSSNDKTIKSWDQKGTCKLTLKVSKPYKFERIHNVHYSGRILALYSHNSPNVELMNLIDNEIFKVLKHNSNVKCLIQLTDGSLITGLENGEIHLWDLYRLESEIIGKSTSEIKYLYHGTRLISLGSEICIWDTYQLSLVEKFDKIKKPEKLIVHENRGYVLENGCLYILDINFPEKKKIEDLQFQSEESGDSFGFFVSGGTIESTLKLCLTSRLFSNMFLSSIEFYLKIDSLIEYLKGLNDERSITFIKLYLNDYFPKVLKDDDENQILNWVENSFPKHLKEIKELIEKKKVNLYKKEEIKKTYKNINILEIAERDFCEQLTLINQEDFNNLCFQDIIYNDLWISKKPEFLPYSTYLNIFNNNENMTNFVVHTILFSKSVNEAIEVIQKWINILIILKKMKNHESLLSIYLGLSISCIHRLKKIFSMISRNHSDNLKSIEQFINVPDGYVDFNKEMLFKSEPPSIPSVYVVYYHTIRFILDQGGKYLSNTHLNFTRIRNLYLSISRLRPFQRIKYSLSKSKIFYCFKK